MMSKRKENKVQDNLTVGQVARHCRVNRRTVQRWIHEGKLSAHALPSGHYRIGLEDFRLFLETYQIPVDPDALGRSQVRVMIVNESDEVVQTLRADLGLIESTIEFETASTVIDACLKISFFRPDILFISHAVHLEFNCAVVRHLRQIDELSATEIALIRPLTVRSDPTALEGIDSVLDWPCTPQALEAIVSEHIQ